MKELSFERMEKIEGGWTKWKCGLAFGVYGLSIASFTVATGGAGLALAGVLYGASIFSVIDNCSDFFQ